MDDRCEPISGMLIFFDVTFELLTALWVQEKIFSVILICLLLQDFLVGVHGRLSECTEVFRFAVRVDTDGHL